MRAIDKIEVELSVVLGRTDMPIAAFAPGARCRHHA